MSKVAGRDGGKTVALIQRGVHRIERGHCFPEVAHHLHAARVVPDVDSDDASWPDDTRQFGDDSRWFWREIEHQARDDDIPDRIWLWYRLRIANREAGTWIGGMCAHIGDKVRRAVN